MFDSISLGSLRRILTYEKVNGTVNKQINDLHQMILLADLAFVY